MCDVFVYKNSREFSEIDTGTGTVVGVGGGGGGSGGSNDGDDDSIFDNISINSHTSVNSSTTKNTTKSTAKKRKLKIIPKRGVSMRAKEVSEHLLNCPNRIVDCPYGCGERTEFEKMKFHENGDCPTRVRKSKNNFFHKKIII